MVIIYRKRRVNEKKKSTDYLFSLIFTLSLLSLGGFPPMLGFYPKVIVLSIVFNVVIILILILSSCINLYYYLRLVYKFNFNIKLESFNNNLNKSSLFIRLCFPLILILNKATIILTFKVN
jgi:NADH-ubiquinone oxidoreductase chain 2